MLTKLLLLCVQPSNGNVLSDNTYDRERH